MIGANTPGRIFTIGTGDDGLFDNHAGGSFSATNETILPFSIRSAAGEYIQIWYTGAVPASITVAMADGTVVGPVQPGTTITGGAGTIQIYHPQVGQDFFQSTSGDRLALINFTNRSGNGEVRIRAQNTGTGRFDAYAYATSNLRFTGLLAPGRISGIAATHSALVTSVYVDRTTWTDVDGLLRTRANEGLADERWLGSSSGPTRDGRSPGCDVSFPGHLGFAAYGRNTEWATVRSNLIQDGLGWYGGYGAASGAAPLLTGATALMLQLDPTLTADRLRQFMRQTARSDAKTGAVPNNDWCYGKVDLYATALAVADASGDPGVMDFGAATVAVTEGTASLDVPLRRLGGRRGSVAVQYRVVSGSATDVQDYTGGSGSITWADGDVANKAIRLTVVDDSFVESAENLTLELSTPAGGRLGLQRTVAVTLNDNDVSQPPALPPTAPSSSS